MRVTALLRDLIRDDYWEHCGPEYDSKKTRTWTYSREDWEPKYRWVPEIGGDEWCRWCIILPIPFGDYLVVALFPCRDPECWACRLDCEPLSTEERGWRP